MNHTEQRSRLRAMLVGSKCRSPASIYDPLSARVAQTAGYEIGWLGGRAAVQTMLAAPDPLVLTLTEVADQIRRIMRVSDLSLVVDAGHGYGNALNVMRTVQELEHAGVSALAIEDTTGPLSFGQAEGTEMLASIEEGVGKMRAAVAARSDPSLVIAGRTPALSIQTIESAIARAEAYAAAGVDAIFVAGDSDADAAADKLAQLSAIHAAAKLPLIVGSRHGALFTHEQLAACGVRLVLQGHQPTAAAVKALRETYSYLFNGGAPAELSSKIASAREMEQLVNGENYKQWLHDYLRLTR